MGFIGLFYPWGIVLQALAVLHFVRRRPDNFWLWIILIGGGLGALVYIVAEVVPDIWAAARIAAGVSAPAADPGARGDDPRQSRGREPRGAGRSVSGGRQVRPRAGAVRQGDLAADGFAGSVLPARHRRAGAGRCRCRGGRPRARRGEGREVQTSIAPSACSHRRTRGTTRPTKPNAAFTRATDASTLSETYCNYAAFLAAEGRSDEARAWAERILAKKPTMPNYLRRRERPWFRKAKALLKSVPQK